ncbi:MAG: hypothetical protein JWO84_548 [Parcubacteria group bacterium]|nr:hypothetical protein [Parcubacteria group bacterium]
MKFARGSLLLLTGIIFIGACIAVAAFYIPHSKVIGTNTVVEHQSATLSAIQAETHAAGPYDGTYVYDSGSPFTGSEVDISSSTETQLDYHINTVHLAHTGDLEGVAHRIASTTIAYTDKTSNEGCAVTISFINKAQIIYALESIPGSDYGCEGYHGAHGEFLDGEVHVKNGLVTLPSLTDRGVSDSDRKALAQLAPDIFPNIESYIGLDISTTDQNSDENVMQSDSPLTSTDIPGSHGFAIQSPNIYNGSFGCGDFTETGGFCSYGAYLTDGHGHYWILSGANGEQFTYMTNNLNWKAKIPAAFKEQLKKLGVTNVKFEK